MRNHTSQPSNEVTFDNVIEFVQNNIETDPEGVTEKVLTLYGPDLANPYNSRRHKATVAALLINVGLAKRVKVLEEKLASAAPAKKKAKKRLGDRLKTTKRPIVSDV